MKTITSAICSVALGVIIIVTGCGSTPTTPPAIASPTFTTAKFALADEQAQQYAEEFIKNTPTFKFDAIDGSLRIVKAEDDNTQGYLAKIYTIEFKTQHPGHGDRTGQSLAQVITTHAAVVMINREQPTIAKSVITAVCDGVWDLLTDKTLKITVSGIVISGNDTTPAGLLDAPRDYIYQIQKTDSSLINVAYTAYPPSPAGDIANHKIFLHLRGGSIQTGDYLSAQGTYDQDTNTVSVANEGDYIATTLTDAGAQRMATDFMQNENATFTFDGIPRSLKLIKTDPGWTSAFRSTAFTFTYQTAHPGHGDRGGQMLAQVITDHTAMVLINIEKGEVASADCDQTWNILTNTDLPVNIGGFVLSGGDTAPADGPLDVPHTFVYQVRQDHGETVYITYTAYPPSPVGDANRKQIILELYTGTINIGDRIWASGMLDKATNTILAAYIHTAVPRIEVTGQITGGGDTGAGGGPQDALHHFVYQVQTENGAVYTVAYTVYPPSPAGEAAMAKFGLTYWNDLIPVKGDYLKAYGLYNVITNTITIADEGDCIKTYPEKP